MKTAELFYLSYTHVSPVYMINSVSLNALFWLSNGQSTEKCRMMPQVSSALNHTEMIFMKQIGLLGTLELKQLPFFNEWDSLDYPSTDTKVNQEALHCI